MSYKESKFKINYERNRQNAYKKLYSSFPNDYETNKRARAAYHRRESKVVKKYGLSASDAYSRAIYERDRNRSNFNRIVPGVLSLFLLTMFFGGFTNAVIQSHTTIVVEPYGSSDFELEYLDYDFTYKLKQLERFRNIFDLNITNDDLSYQNLLIYDSAFQYYYNHEIIYWHSGDTDLTVPIIHGWNIKPDAESDAYRVYNYRGNIGIFSLQDDFNNYLYRSLYSVENDVLIRSDLYYKVRDNQNNDVLTFFKTLGNIFFVYPFAVIYNLSYDLGVVSSFVFDW